MTQDSGFGLHGNRSADNTGAYGCPKLSVIVPVYNTGRYVRDCIDSILGQSYRNFELIIVDDGSTDSSLQICREYESSDGRVKVIHKENGGVASARNAGIEAASGDFVTFVDSDDWLREGAFGYAAGKLAETGSDMLAFGIIKITAYKSFLYNAEPDRTGPLDRDIRHLAIGGYFFRLSTLQEHRIMFTEGLAYSEDRVFIFSFSPYCRQVTTCQESFYIYRSNDGAATSSRNGARIMENQFRAASIMFPMSKDCLYGNLRGQIAGQAKKAVKWGIYAVVRYGDRESLRMAKEMFFRMFSGEYRHPTAAWHKLVFTRRLLAARRSATSFLRAASRLITNRREQAGLK